MKFIHAVKVFDRVEPSLEGYPNLPGRISCCGVSVTENGQNGRREIYCSICGTQILENTHGDWFVRVAKVGRSAACGPA